MIGHTQEKEPEWISVEDFVEIADLVKSTNLLHQAWGGKYTLSWLPTFEAIGFKMADRRGYIILINEEKRLVLKRSYVSDPKTKPAIAIPTEILAGSMAQRSEAILLQPLADDSVEAREDAWAKQHEFTYAERDCFFGFDSHAGNFAKWRGRDVVIDW